MNYAAIYDRLIERAMSRKIAKPFDRHHIVPRSLGGSDAKDNIAKLSVREHIFAHVLLAKIHPDNFKLVSCAFRMMHGSRSSKSASWLREKFVEGISGDNNPLRNPEIAAKLSSSKRGKVVSAEARARMSEAGKKRWERERSLSLIEVTQ